MGVRRRRLRGFSLLETIVIVVVLAIVVVLVVPQLLKGHMASNEAAAALNLRSLAAVQAAFRLERFVDQDADGVGEHGLLGELAGELTPRAGAKPIGVPPLPAIFVTGGAEGNGCAVCDGYVYRVWLAQSVAEDETVVFGDDHALGGKPGTAGRTLSDVDAIDHQESHFIAYAWPLEPGSSGREAFAITEAGRLVATDMAARRYGGVGLEQGPTALAAVTGGPGERKLAQEAQGSDGNLWRPAPEPLR